MNPWYGMAMTSNTRETENAQDSERFDPFTHRLSRDVRNTLSTALAQSFSDEDSKIFETAAADWLNRLSHDSCRRYVGERLRRYREAFDAVSRLPSDRLLQQIAILWNLALYFEVNEVAEEEFHAASGSYRKFLQGIIFAAGVFVQQEAGRHEAARPLSQRAIGILTQHRSRLSFLKNQEAFLDGLRQDPPKAVPMDF